MGTHDVGDEVGLPAGAVGISDRALIELDGFAAVVRYLPHGENVPEYVARRKNMLADDPRTISVPSTSALRSSSDAVQEMIEDKSITLPPTGPLTAAYFVRSVASAGHGLPTRHDRWLRESGVSPGSADAFEHQLISRSLELAATVDGLDLMNLGMTELLARRMQNIEEAVIENPSQPSFEGSGHYLGVSERKGGAIVAPSLGQHVASELAKEAAILKERREAREAKNKQVQQVAGALLPPCPARMGFARPCHPLARSLAMHAAGGRTIAVRFLAFPILPQLRILFARPKIGPSATFAHCRSSPGALAGPGRVAVRDSGASSVGCLVVMPMRGSEL